MKKSYLIKNHDLISNEVNLKELMNDKDIKCTICANNERITIDAKEIDFEENLHKASIVLAHINQRIILEEYDEGKTYRKVLLLNNLDCPNCAMKIENLAKKEFNAISITVDFATSRFVIETADVNLYDNIIEEVERVARIVDKKIVVTDKEISAKAKQQIEEKKINKPIFIIGAVLYILLLVLHYIVFNSIYENYNLDNINDNPTVKYPLIAIAIGSYLLLGGDVLLTALNNIKNKRFFDEKFLMSLATIVAFGIHNYVEAISVMIFYKIGELLQEKVVRNSRKSISELMDIKPTGARVLIDEKETEIDPSQLTIGDVLVVKPGERIPADGIVKDGEANLDTSALTGETKYQEVSFGSTVMSGSINLDGVLYIEVKKKYSESLVSKILDLVENANTNKAKTEKFVTKFAKYYTPIVCILAVLIAVVFCITGYRDLHDSLYSAMIFLVVSCPCALVISVPLGYFGAIGGASKRGILIKGSNYLDDLSNVGLICFDKTGTLTKGQFVVKAANSLNEKYTNEDILRIAAHCESMSNHPIAKSIVSYFGIENLNVNDVTVMENNKKGLRVAYDNCSYLIGNDSYMKEHDFDIADEYVEGLNIYLASKDGVIGYIELIDEIRPESKDTIKKLKEAGYDIAMLTGDNEFVAKRVADELGIDKYFASCNPIEKVKRIRKLKKDYRGQKVAFVGDGINDAPVLTNSDIGIAMGRLGTDAAIEVSDIVLMNDDLTKLLDLFKITKKTRKIVLENIVFALFIKLLVLILAIVVESGKVFMWEGVFADVGVSLIAIINSLRVSSIDKNQFISNFYIHKIITKFKKNKEGN